MHRLFPFPWNTLDSRCAEVQDKVYAWTEAFLINNGALVTHDINQPDAVSYTHTRNRPEIAVFLSENIFFLEGEKCL